MRYYRIEIGDGPDMVYTSFDTSSTLLGPFGSNIPGALQVQFDIPVYPFANPGNGGASVSIWGVGLDVISQAKDLNKKNIKVYGGFQKGLPLANPSQAGLLVQGYIFQAFGNWLGVDQTLDLVILPGMAPPTAGKPLNLTLNWKKGTALGDALKNMLTTAYSGFTADVSAISSKLTAVSDQVAVFSGIVEVSEFIKRMSRTMIGTSDYPGVDIVLNQKQFTAYDGTGTQQQSKAITYTDLIGQPTWIQSPLISFKTMMRYDLAVGNNVTLPKTVVTNSAQAQTSLSNQNVSFAGGFKIQSVRHVGNFRQPDAYSWVTEFNASPLTQASNTP